MSEIFACHKKNISKWNCVGGFNSFLEAGEYSRKYQDSGETILLETKRIFPRYIQRKILEEQLKPVISIVDK